MMNSDFPRVLSLLRKEKGISQKQAAAELGISQALLSHYEKGIRECGLNFLVKCAKFYDVSTDYLLGLSPDRNGAVLVAEDIPDPEAAGKENVFKGSILPTLNKKLIANSLNILYDYLGKSGNKDLINEVSLYLMLAVYQAFRLVHSGNKNNQDALFTIPKELYRQYTDAAMQISLARAAAIARGDKLKGLEPVANGECFAMDTQSLTKTYPLFVSSLLNLIKNAEGKVHTVSGGDQS